MNTKLNFTLANFQDHSAYVTFWIECTEGTDWQEWRQLYVTDLSVDGKPTGKAHCCFGYEDWAKHLRISDKYDWLRINGQIAETNFTLDGSIWYTVWEDPHTVEITKWSANEGGEYLDEEAHSAVWMTYKHLKSLVDAAAAKEPPK